MKIAIRTLIAFCIGYASFSLYAQGPTFQWAQQATGSSTEQGVGIGIDTNGNSYVAGVFSGTAAFGSTILTSGGELDGFVAKYDNAGNAIRAKRCGGELQDGANAIAVDGGGNSYVTGWFSGTGDFGGTNMTSSGSRDVFVAKYDSAGNLVWARQTGGSDDDMGLGIAVDTGGNCFVTGWCSGSGQYGGTTLTSSGGFDVFVMKLSSAGSVLWATNAGGTSGDSGFGIAVDGSGNSYVTGNFSGAATIGGIALRTLASYGVVVAKFDSAGKVVWAKTAGESGDTLGYGIAVDASGNSHVVGNFRGTVTFGSTTLSNTLSFGDEVFIAKYDSAGNALWAQQGVGSDDNGYGIAVDGAGVYVTGLFRGNANIGGINLASSGDADVFVARYDSAGNPLWAKSAGGSSGDDLGLGIAVDAAGSEYITGQFVETATFDGVTLSKSGSRSFFIAKLGLALPISIDRLGINLRLNWSSGTLLSADDVNGPWNPVAGASSPWVVTPNSPKKFYRLQQ